MTATSLESREALITAMQTAEFYDHEVGDIVMIQTHISWVFLTGKYAYKVKKPMDFGFLNFTTLERRKHFCEEEIRLNKRLADKIYLQTVAIGGTESAPKLGAEDGEAIEYAIKMAQFDQEQLVDKLLKEEKLTAEHIDQIADQVADFHQSIATAGPDMELGSAESVNAPVIQNFDQLDPLITDAESRAQLERLRNWSAQEFNKIQSVLEARKAAGYIRECHGDMHLGNMALIDNQITIFDGIEFNDEFRWIDVMSEVAFLTMDLHDRGAFSYASRFLNRYFENTGDYQGIQVLRFYLVYRAMVRAKIASFTLLTPDLDDQTKADILAQYHSYTNLAEAFTEQAPSMLYITHGISGSGKTTGSQPLIESDNLIRLRSDIERKRMYGLKPSESSRSALNQGIYTAESNEKTYSLLLELAETIIRSGYSPLIDATFLDKANRDKFRQLADNNSAEFKILHFNVDKAELEKRIEHRSNAGRDASEADLDIALKQLENYVELDKSELEFVMEC